MFSFFNATIDTDETCQFFEFCDLNGNPDIQGGYALVRRGDNAAAKTVIQRHRITNIRPAI